MNASVPSAVLKQHLIDPEICIRCNTCEATCPVGAITHDALNYVVKADVCNGCMDCISPCPTGSIDNWRMVPRAQAYSIEEQLKWDELPAQLPLDALPTPEANATENIAAEAQSTSISGSNAFGSTQPPWSAAHPYTNLYGPKAASKTISATVSGNVRVTQVGTDYDTHHIVLDFGQLPFPVLEGQSIGIVPPGLDAQGRAHHARQYSVASPRNGERPGYNNLSLTVKRVLEDPQGRPLRGVASNYLCDLQVGDVVQVIGPFGSSFLMPNHPGSHVVMICTGTGSAPMRAMTEWRRRLRAKAQASISNGAVHTTADSGKLMLFFGARSQAELPYFGPLQKLPTDFIDTTFVYSRTPGQPKRYVQDAMRERAAELAVLLQDPNSYFYVCGLKSMEEGVLLALQNAAEQAGLNWAAIGSALKQQGRLHLETY